MADDANALLKGMLGIGVDSVSQATSERLSKNPTTDSDSKNKNGVAEISLSGSKAKTKKHTRSKSNKVNNDIRKSGKTSKVKRDETQNIRRSSQDNNSTDPASIDVGDEKNERPLSKNNQNTNGKGKKNRRKHSKVVSKDDDGTKNKPELDDSKEHETKLYAWSAFQSGPDPSTLPDIGGLFLSADESDVNVEEHRSDVEEGNDLGSSLNVTTNHTSVPSPADTPPTLVDSILAKADGNVNAGEALLKSLASPISQTSTAMLSPPMNEHIRTAESLEAEMLLPQRKPAQSRDITDPLSHPPATESFNTQSLDGNKGINEKEDNVMPSADFKFIDPAIKDMSASMENKYPDPISQLMNPGGVSVGPINVQDLNVMAHPPQNPGQQHAPYHYPLHNAPPMHNFYSGHLGHPQHHYPYPVNPYHPIPQNYAPPGYTTVQVRVPRVLLPGNTMLVDGIQIHVPMGVPPGAIIPVNIPTYLPQYNHEHYYGHPSPPTPPPPHYLSKVSAYHTDFPSHDDSQYPLMIDPHVRQGVTTQNDTVPFSSQTSSSGQVARQFSNTGGLEGNDLSANQ